MKFSVLMSVYHKENPEFLKEAIDSVINQTVQPTEIVIVKDGKLTKELDDVIDMHIKDNEGLFNILELETNCGLGVALSKGINACKYDIIARMDSDDISNKYRFEKQLDIFKKNTKVDIVGSNIAEFMDDVNIICSERKVPENNDDIIKFAKKRCPFNHMTVMYKKQAVLDAGNYIKFESLEDYYLWARMLKNGCYALNIQENLVYARIGNGMFKRRSGLGYVKSEIKLQKQFKSLGFINNFELGFNILSRMLVRIIPNNMREIIYFKLLRSNSK